MMRRVTCGLALLCACGGEPDSSGTGGTTTGTASAGSGTTSAAPAAATTRENYSDSVIVGNPLVVHGRARTFENTVQVRVRDTSGAAVMEIYETSVGEMGHHNPFSARVWLVRDPGSWATVESFEYSAKDGSERSLTSRRVELPMPRRTVTLVFPGPDCDATVPVERVVPRAEGVAQLLVHALIAGPTSAERTRGASNPFPPGSRVRGVSLRDGTITVDFDERLRNVGGSCAARAIRSAVTATLGRLPGVRRVTITAGGSESEALQP